MKTEFMDKEVNCKRVFIHSYESNRDNKLLENMAETHIVSLARGILRPKVKQDKKI